MKIQIDEKEIGEAVSCYLEKQGVNVSKYDLSFNIVAGRGDIGPRVEISLDTKVEVENIEASVKDGPTNRLPFGSNLVDIED